jgi:hypothetical protein
MDIALSNDLQEPDAPWKKVVALEKEGCLSFQK